jgi:hypothetical protein
MSNATIQIVFQPLGNIFGLTYYHETLLYTNAQGQQFYASAGSTADGNGPGLWQLSQPISGGSIGG